MLATGEGPSGQVGSIAVEPAGRACGVDVGEVWRYRELLYFLVWREVKVRYKQTLIGAAWAVLQPAMTMAIFTVIFGRLAGIPSDGVPYPLFAYAALLPWTYFSEAVGRGGLSLVGDANLIRKVYFPRVLIPVAAVVAPIVDFCFAFALLLGMLAWYGVAPSMGVLMLPAFVLLAVTTALAVSLWLSALNVRYRDVRHTIPFLLQIWMYVSPVVYPVSVVPADMRVLYGLNPMVGVIEGFRWGLLGRQAPDPALIAMSVLMVAGLLAGGLVFFRRQEPALADVV